MEMTYEELNARLASLESRLDAILTLVTKANSQRQSEMLGVKQIADMLNLSVRDLYNKKYLLPNFGECEGKKQWTRREVESWLTTDTSELKRMYIARAKKDSV